MTILRKIEENEKKRQELILHLTDGTAMVKGSFCQIHVKCGKKNCHCNKGKGHSHWRMSLKENGMQFSRAVPSEDYEWVSTMTANYREFKNLRKQLQKIENKSKKLLDLYESSCLKQSKKGKKYLNVQITGSKEKKQKR